MQILVTQFRIDACVHWVATDTGDKDCLSLQDMLKRSARTVLKINEDGDFDITNDERNFIVTFTPAALVVLPRKGSYVGSIINGIIEL